MNFSSKYLEDAVDHFASLPGVGKKTALRLVLNILKRDEEEVKAFAKTLDSLHEHIKQCKVCGNISDQDICGICNQQSRNHQIICVVEDIRDILAIESTEQFFGVYHVLGGVISPMDGIGPNDLNISSLFDRIQEHEVEEIILALNSSMEGDTTNFYLYKKIEPFGVKVTSLLKGVSVGTELHYADELTLGRSITNRLPFELSFKK
ncbi:MAG: recombination mediator RecR [Putridiphycobacter sp.]